ncbi:DUF6519 domain-containing protein [Actinomadura sp. HBU206391]|uniref:DUF6519 domain-containing protein n=1 Tax=Actinomadura sp. HBU206391 TaxID=2731692 RepID=UPI00164F398C|nr:DUF6519 domain-containing protein [Actinomadura sp. HBU206391]MBC6461725.1 hypothetical protein [Actinomadura sp. HBU206391]
MEGDFSRSTFRPDKRYSAVLAQQGRVQLDADANEQAAIQLHLARTLAADVIGAHGGPQGAAGFEIEYVNPRDQEPADLRIGDGRYYVDGILVDATRPTPLEVVPSRGDDDDAEPEPPEGEWTWTYWDQPDAYRDAERDGHRLPGRFPFLVYLKVRERLVTALQDPEIRESALGAAMPDTAARAKVTWQVLPLRLKSTEDPVTAFDDWVAEQTAEQAFLAARSERPARVEDDPCVLPPDVRYRGPENQLYRVEVHRGGSVRRPGGSRSSRKGATFKWSRENGSVAYAIDSVDGAWVTLAAFGRDDKLDLHVGDWVEVGDDASAMADEPAPLLEVEEVDVSGRRVRLSDEPADDRGRIAARHPLLRRWDHRRASGRDAPDLDQGAVTISEGDWVDLEDGVQIWLRQGGEYRAGDHWLIAARTLTGEVEWPRDATGRALLRPPEGIRDHYAPLAWVTQSDEVQDLRHLFGPLTAGPAPQATLLAGDDVGDAPVDEPVPPTVDVTTTPDDGPQDDLPQEAGSIVESEIKDDEGKGS